jgi:hypothetical protein
MGLFGKKNFQLSGPNGRKPVFYAIRLQILRHGWKKLKAEYLMLHWENPELVTRDFLRQQLMSL